MNTQRYFAKRSTAPGFTLIELLVAMTITVFLIGVLVYLTSIASDSYRKSQNDIRASRQAKEALDIIAKDFEGMVARRDGNAYEWLFAETDSTLSGPSGKEITNRCRIVFFTGATDRYGGNIGGSNDKGGDISAVSYRLVYKDQISGGSPTSEGDYPVFSLYRHLVNPDETFSKLLASDDLSTASKTVFSDANDLVAENFLVENIYEFTVTFLIEVIDYDPMTKIETKHIVRATMKPGGMTQFVLAGNEIKFVGNIELPAGVTNDQIKEGSIVGAEVSITVLTDQGMTLIQRLPAAAWEKQASKYMRHYTKTITTPRP